MRFIRRARSLRAVIVPAVVAALIAFPLGVLASHSFSDVPTSHPFHADIAALKDSGVSTTGCGGGKFCPDDFVTRGQMAAFLNRLGALGPGKVPVANATKLDGKDSTEFVQNGAAAGEDLTGTYPDPGIADGTITNAKLAPRESIGRPTLGSCDGGANLWTNGATSAMQVGFWKDRSGVVHLQGATSCGGNATEGGLIFTLPAGYRPAFLQGGVHWATLAGGSVMAHIEVLDNATGQVVYVGPDSTTADDYISFDGLTFRAED